MAQCSYHPDKRSTAKCPQCQEPICDRCRINGTSLRCMSCQSIFSKGGTEEQRAKRAMCTNHAGVPTDIKCTGCKKPHCAACLNGQNKCFKCALAEPTPAPGARGRSKTTPIKGGAKTGKLKAPPPKPGMSWALIAGVAAVVVVGALAAFVMLKPAEKEPPPAYAGPAGVAIASPSNRRVLSGNQVIKLKVTAPSQIEDVVLTVDGKYWDKFTQPPFQSDWQTALVKNGKHVIQAKVVYKGRKKTAVAKTTVTTKNRRY